MTTIIERDELYANAACKENPEGSEIFYSSRRKETDIALSYCEKCPVVALCERVVLEPIYDTPPAFTGVAGGKVFLKGRERKATSHLFNINWERVRRSLRSKGNTLSPRERRAACVVGWAAGLSIEEIAFRLDMSVTRVKRCALYRADNKLTDDENARALRLGATFRTEE